MLTIKFEGKDELFFLAVKNVFFLNFTHERHKQSVIKRKVTEKKKRRKKRRKKIKERGERKKVRAAIYLRAESVK